MIKNEFTLETVTFNGTQSEGYSNPEISGYGNNVQVLMEYHNCENKKDSVTIKLGTNLFLPSQLKYIVKQYEAYLEALKAEID